MKKQFQLWALSGALLTGSLTASNAMPMPDPEPIKAAITANFDRIFMIHAAQTNMAEVMMGKLALRKTKNADVRMIARTTMMDHGKAQRDLASHFRAMNVPMPPDPGMANKAVYEKLSTLRGRAFDKAYMAVQVGAHENSVTLFSHEVMHGGGNSIAKMHAQNKLPGILGHTAMIYEVAKKVGAPGVNLRPPAVIQAAMQANMKMGEM